MPEAAAKPKTGTFKLAPPNPFRGLRRFEMEDSALFFGRDEQTYEVLRRLRTMHFVAVLGPSGSGKSSLIRAGVLAALRDGYMANEQPWKLVVLQPGNGPVEAWTDALRPYLRQGMEPAELAASPEQAIDTGGSNLAILVDQFEELFQYAARTGRERDVRLFLQAMLGAASGREQCMYVIVTMRTEYLSQCAEYPNLADAINAGLYLVPTMTREQMREAIVQPVRKVGAEITAPLVDRLLNDATGQTDALPILQHALMRMWTKKRDWEPLGLPEYEAQIQEAKQVGGKDAAAGIGAFLSAHADEVLKSLGPGQTEAAESLFETITELTEDGRAVRRAMPLSDVAKKTGYSEDKLKPVADRFEQEGFLNYWKTKQSNSLFVDLSHEAIARQWPTLREWMREAQQARRMLHRIEDASAEWAGHNRDSGYLFRGLQLQNAKFSLSGWDDELSPKAREFLQASKRDERNSTWIKRVAVVAFITVLAGAFVEYQTRVARLEAQNAEVAKSEALNSALSAQTAYAQAKRESVPAVGSATPRTAQMRVFIQILNASQNSEATSIANHLKSLGFQIAPFEQVSVGPKATDVRYFRKTDRAHAEEIVKALNDLSIASTSIYVPGFEKNTSIKPGHFEIWLGK